jgi:hypothetical protein
MSNFDFKGFIFLFQIWSHVEVYFITNPTIPHLHFFDFIWCPKVNFQFLFFFKRKGRAGHSGPAAQLRWPLRPTRPGPACPQPFFLFFFLATPSPLTQAAHQANRARAALELLPPANVQGCTLNSHGCYSFSSLFPSILATVSSRVQYES